MNSNKLIQAAVNNPVFANLVAVVIIVAGVTAARSMPRETFPDTAVDHILVTVAFPGASPGDVEQGIAIKIEEAMRGLPGVWEITSLSEENSGLIVAAVDSTILPAEEVLRQLRDRIDAITTLPADALDPVAINVVVRSPVISIGVHGNASERTIKEVAEQVRTDLLAMTKISQVGISGVRDYEISITVTKEAMQRFNLSLQEVVDAIRRSSLDVPAGTIRTTREEINVRTLGQRYSSREFADLVVIAQPDGTTVRLGQIAHVTDAFEQSSVFGRVNGRPGALLTVAKTGPEDISELASVVRDYVKAANADLPPGIDLTIWADMSRDVDSRLDMLLWNGVMGMALVLVCLLIFLDLRSALAVALGIPVAYAGAIVVTSWTGSTLNLISLLGLIMATGIIVDDAIVIAESVRTSTRAGLSSSQAAIIGTNRIFLPVFLSSVTTIIAFAPLMYVQGVMGKLIFSLPVVVIAAILASGVEAFLILPSHLAEWGKMKEAKKSTWRYGFRSKVDRWVDGLITQVYRPWLLRALRGRLVLLGGALAGLLVCVGFVLGGWMPFVLFSKFDGNSLRARVRFPEGTPIEVSQAAADQIERAVQMLNDDPDLAPDSQGPLVERVYTTVGEWAEFVPRRGSGRCEVSLELMPAEDRRVDSGLIQEKWRRYIGTIENAASVSITREQLGPTEKPLEIRLLGDNLEQLHEASLAVEAKLASFEGVFDVGSDLLPGKRELQVSLKQGASSLGISVADLAAQLRQGLFGGSAVVLQRGLDEIRAVVSFSDSDRRSLSSIDNFRIRTRTGVDVPFHQVARTKLVSSYAGIGRQDGKRRVRVQANVNDRVANAEQILQSLEVSFLPQLQNQYEGVIYKLDGQRARISESLGSLASGIVVAFVLMYALIALPLRSYTQPMIVLGAIPFAAIGSVFGHYIMGYDLTLMSVFGIVALMGIVINDNLVLLDKMRSNLDDGMPVWASVCDAGESRFRAVMLTSITTIAGMFPLLMERSSQAQTIIPMVISMVFGLAFDTILTLFLVPSFFVIANDVKRFFRWCFRGGRYPTREDVEDTLPVSSATVPA